SRTACRIFSNLRFRRCFRCCAASSTRRSRCSVRWWARFTWRAASRSLRPASSSSVGARPVLLTGMTLLIAGTLAASFAPGPAWLFPAVAVMGVGNGVFHPADFAILNASVDVKRLGYAYSMHGVGGNLGYAL